MKERMKVRAHELMGATSLCDLYVRVCKLRGACIVAYHSVVPPDRKPLQDHLLTVLAETFEAQMEFLARHRKVISLDALAQMLEEGRSADPGSVVITFDDGYLDNLEIAAPILARHGFPATVFLATGYIERGENMWVDELCCAFRERTGHLLELPDASFDLSVSGEAGRAYRKACGVLLGARREARDELLASIRTQLAPSCPQIRLMMSWHEVRSLRERFPNIAFGAHTREHIDLSGARPEVVAEELSGAHEDIRRELGFEPEHFAYPYGRFSETARAWLSSHGYRSGMVTGPARPARASSDPLRLHRLDVRPGFNSGFFSYHTSGAHPGLSKAVLFGRA